MNIVKYSNAMAEVSRRRSSVSLPITRRAEHVYNENFDSENWNDDYVYSDGDEGFLDESARKNFIFTKYLYSRLTNGIKANTENLSKLEIAQSRFFAIPKPNVPTLVPGTGLNTEIKQNSDSNVVKGIENKLELLVITLPKRLIVLLD